MIRKRYRRGVSTPQHGEPAPEKMPKEGMLKDEAFPERELSDTEVKTAWDSYPGLEFGDFFKGRKLH